MIDYIKKVMAKQEFVIFMNFVRIALLVGVAVIIYILVKEITAVKILAYDPCKICMNQTGCNCACFKPFG